MYFAVAGIAAAKASLTFCHEVIDGFLGGVGAGAHDNDDFLRVGSAHVIEEVIFSAGEGGNFLHIFGDYSGNRSVIFIGGFSVLEVYVAVLRGAFLNGVFGVKGACAEFVDVFHVDELFHILVIDGVDLADFVAGAEAVEEVDERNFRFEGGEVRHEREVHGFLNGVGSEHRKTGLTASHNVGVVAENVKSVSGEGSCRNMENAGEKFARDLVHIGDHEEQSLTGGISGGESAGAKGAVNGARGTRLGLHFGKSQGLSEHVFNALSSPFVGVFRHGRGGGYGVNGGDFAESVSDVRCGGITVDGHFFAHCEPPLVWFKI